MSIIVEYQSETRPIESISISSAYKDSGRTLEVTKSNTVDNSLCFRVQPNGTDISIRRTDVGDLADLLQQFMEQL